MDSAKIRKFFHSLRMCKSAEELAVQRTLSQETGKDWNVTISRQGVLALWQENKTVWKQDDKTNRMEPQPPEYTKVKLFFRPDFPDVVEKGYVTLPDFVPYTATPVPGYEVIQSLRSGDELLPEERQLTQRLRSLVKPPMPS